MIFVKFGRRTASPQVCARRLEIRRRLGRYACAVAVALNNSPERMSGSHMLAFRNIRWQPVNGAIQVSAELGRMEREGERNREKNLTEMNIIERSQWTSTASFSRANSYFMFHVHGSNGICECSPKLGWF